MLQKRKVFLVFHVDKVRIENGDESGFRCRVRLNPGKLRVVNELRVVSEVLVGSSTP